MLQQGIAVKIEQSPFLSLVSEERVQQTLRLMGRSADARLTPEIGREVCERTAVVLPVVAAPTVTIAAVAPYGTPVHAV